MGRNNNMKVSFTISAKKLLSEIKEVHGDDLCFTNREDAVMVARLCVFQQKNIINSDVKLGEVDGTPYMNEDQYEKWKHTDLTIDAVKELEVCFP